jgi:hypothetical protein
LDKSLSQIVINLLFNAFVKILKLQLIKLISLNFFNVLASSSFGIRVIMAWFNLAALILPYSKPFIKAQELL